MTLRRENISSDFIHAEEEKLFSTWKQRYNNFVPDGCPDPTKYSSAPIKLLFVLKEVNGGENWDLRDFMKNGCRPETWNVIARWIESIFNIDKNYTWNELSQNNDERRQMYVPQVCAVNVKKSPGGCVADKDKISIAVENDKQLIKEQIALYKADITVLCGTEGFYTTITEDKPQWKMTSRGIWYYVDSLGGIVISYSHPEARVKQQLLHYGLIDAVKEIISTEC